MCVCHMNESVKKRDCNIAGKGGEGFFFLSSQFFCRNLFMQAVIKSIYFFFHITFFASHHIGDLKILCETGGGCVNNTVRF